MKKKLLMLILAAAVLGTGAFAYTERARIAEVYREWQRPDVPVAVSHEQVRDRAQDAGSASVTVAEDEEPAPEKEPVPPSPEDLPAPDSGSSEDMSEEEPAPSTPPTSADLPTSFNLAVPFTPQAPHANWDQPYADACEEASVYMTHLFYAGTAEGRVDPDRADADLLKLVEFQKSIFGDYKDTTASQTGIFAEQFYGYSRVEVVNEPTVESIKRHIVAGRPVIVPAAGRVLANPYYTPPGPDYHMVVVRGYTPDGFIVNDPGTRRGEAWVYEYDHFMESIHDWTGDPTQVQQGKKVVLVIYPEA